ncbi:hypothetical protein FB466_0641 [Klugiella xanthotipulae]|uniref:Uncharacterized protein n=1 Tax=Klugiella xanthotipulae TaxID=244735 RepID=A0A543I5H9_9MICO|nr:hypothetical protein FB466_0641 [Klugiella xanthotipulae]
MRTFLRNFTGTILAPPPPGRFQRGEVLLVSLCTGLGLYPRIARARARLSA